MAGKRLSAVAKERIAFTHDRLSRALEVTMLARRMGRVSAKTLAIIAELKRDHERAIDGKRVPAFDCFGGRGIWNSRKEKAA